MSGETGAFCNRMQFVSQHLYSCRPVRWAIARRCRLILPADKVQARVVLRPAVITAILFFTLYDAAGRYGYDRADAVAQSLCRQDQFPASDSRTPIVEQFVRDAGCVGFLVRVFRPLVTTRSTQAIQHHSQ
jgi:hypothetical protein